MRSILLANGQLVVGEAIRDQDLLIEDGKIAAFLDRGAVVPEGAEVFDCSGKMIIPGAIDVHVHFREPGQSYKEDWITGSSAAVAGGVTTVFDMPNNKPPIFTCADLEEKRKLVDGRTYANYGLYIGFNGRNHEEINKAQNIPAVKFYACDSTGDLGVEEGVEELFEKCNKLIVVHSEDGDIIEANAKKYLEGRDESELTPDLHSKIRSAEAAIVMTRKLCELAKKYNHRLHIAHLSTAGELKVLDEYQGSPITCEVSPHHLIFSEDDYVDLGSRIRMNPPVRSREDVFALWKGLKFGDVDIVATDHAPHTIEEKAEAYKKVPSGVPGVEHMLPILLNTVNMEGLTIHEVVKLCAEKPAEIFGVKNKGRLEVGYDADVVVVDMELEKTVDKGFSKCGWNPYEGMMFKGWPVKTFVNGVLVFDEGKICGEKAGKEVAFL